LLIIWFHGVHENSNNGVREMGVAAGGYVNNRWDGEWNGNNTWLSLGAGIGMNSWEGEGVELKMTFRSSLSDSDSRCQQNWVWHTGVTVTYTGSRYR